MGRGLPSMTALLGLLAVAGYQNRDKIGELLGGGRQDSPDADRDGGADARRGAGGQGGGLGDLLGGLGGAGAGGILSGGLGELLDRFKRNGQGETAESWVGTGPNRQIGAPELEQAIGPDVLEELSQKTGLPREELVARLSRELPDAVDKYTPEGRVPTEDEAARA